MHFKLQFCVYQLHLHTSKTVLFAWICPICENCACRKASFNVAKFVCTQANRPIYDSPYWVHIGLACILVIPNSMDDMGRSAPLLDYRERATIGKRLSSCWSICTAPLRSFWDTVCVVFSWISFKVWELLTKEPAKTIHAFKMGLALSLAFLLVLLDAAYALFGSHAIWAIMTVIVVFELTIGFLIFLNVSFSSFLIPLFFSHST